MINMNTLVNKRTCSDFEVINNESYIGFLITLNNVCDGIPSEGDIINLLIPSNIKSNKIMTKISIDFIDCDIGSFRVELNRPFKYRHIFEYNEEMNIFSIDHFLKTSTIIESDPNWKISEKEDNYQSCEFKFKIRFTRLIEFINHGIVTLYAEYPVGHFIPPILEF